MKILMSQLPKTDWWGKGTPVYENNWSMELGKIPDAAITSKEHQGTIDVVKLHADIEIIPFPPELDTPGVYKHDAVFVRDSFISNQKGKIVMSNFAAKERQPEADLLQRYLEKNGFTVFTLSRDAYAEGGEFYYSNHDNLLFAGVSRNNHKGVEETAKLLEVDTFCIIESDSYHLDTIFTTLMDTKGKLIGMVICMELVKNPDEIKQFANNHNLPIFTIAPHDAIDYNGKGIIGVNCLPLPGLLIGGALFETPGIEETLKQMGIAHIVAPVTQFHLSGGGTHCLTNELSF